MSDERMIRIDNLRLLMKQNGWNKADLAREIGSSDTYVSRLLNQQASFGEKAARKIEEKAKKPRGWLDVVHLDGEYSDTSQSTAIVIGEPDRALSAYQGSSAFVNPSTSDTLVPIIGWERLEMLYLENDSREFAAAQKAPSEGEAGPRDKWVVMNDDSMEGRFPFGSKLLIRPTEPNAPQPAPGKFILIKDGSGLYAVRRYKQVSPRRFLAEALNQGYATQDSERDQLTIEGQVLRAVIEC